MGGWPDISVPGFRNTAPANEGGFNADDMCACCPTLTYQQRVIGFVTTMIVGYILSFVGTLLLIGGGPAGIRGFAVLYVLGNLIALSGTGFLIGPKSHCKKMFHKNRRFAAIFYLVMLLVVFIAAVAGAFVAIVLVLLVIQCIAAVWYTASYIPYGRTMIINTFCGPCKDSFKDCTGDEA
ncbi:Got1/Sft2-like family-domain-containing protein [Tribonema minus]|uniref:Vesicle transport protein n=1 Tax=Tribonema minus TaxID=303371 RepID=A0A835YKD4_9STRA|nr:Got1/Sft2-like family-domain-containing protein [Tribonema minus]